MTTRRIDSRCSVAGGTNVAPVVAATLVPDLAGPGAVAGPPAEGTP